MSRKRTKSPEASVDTPIWVYEDEKIVEARKWFMPPPDEDLVWEFYSNLSPTDASEILICDKKSSTISVEHMLLLYAIMIGKSINVDGEPEEETEDSEPDASPNTAHPTRVLEDAGSSNPMLVKDLLILGGCPHLAGSELILSPFIGALEEAQMADDIIELLAKLSISEEEATRVGGDFNAILHDGEKEGGRRKPRAIMDDFRELIEDVDIKTKNGWYTWANNREGTNMIKERFDRFLVSKDVIEDMPYMVTKVTVFTYDVCWAKEKEARNIITRIWTENNGDVLEKMDKVREELGPWQHKRYRRTRNQIRGLEWKIDKLMDNSNREDTTNLLKMARIRWLREGDRNTHYFHIGYGPHRLFWRTIRKMKTLAKIRIFCWRIGNEILPTYQKISTIRKEFAKLLDGEYTRCVDWIEDAMGEMDLQAVSDFITTLWNSWNNKNNFISRGKEEEARIVSERASSLSKEFRIHNLTNKPILPVTPVEMNWVKPQNGIIKINFDATIAPTIMGYWIIARDWDGFVLGGSEGFIESGMQADWAELRAFEESIDFRKMFNFKDVQFEMDSAGLVNRINNRYKDLTMMGRRLKEVCPHLRDFNSSNIIWASRYSNRIANLLGKRALINKCNLTFLMDYLLEIHDLVLKDAINCGRPFRSFY
ncbi:hypothetical protein Gotur_015235 [Gossypium turneri]